jgi:hypothetical protein
MFWPRNRGEGATRPSENKGGYWAAIYRREEMDRRCWPCWVFIGERERDVIYLSFFSRIFSPFFVHVTLSLSLSLFHYPLIRPKIPTLYSLFYLFGILYHD